MATEMAIDERTAISLTPADVDRPPNYLYKYRSTDERLRQILVGNSLYYSSPKDFKDTLDCRIPTELSGPPNDIRSYCDRLITEGWPSMLPDERNRRVDQFISEGRWKNTAREVQSLVNNCGVLCLSEHWDGPSMWEEYAQNHAGVCLEFLAADETGMTRFGSNSFKITYSERLKFNLLSDPWEQAKGILLTKLTKWTHEHEWRIILRSPVGSSTVGNWLFPPEFLTGVIFGYKADDTTIERVKGWLAEGKCRPALYQAGTEGASLTKKRIE